MNELKYPTLNLLLKVKYFQKKNWKINVTEKNKCSKCSLLLRTYSPNKLQIFSYSSSIYFVCLPDCCFPIDIEWVKSDHEFLDQDALDSLCR